MPTDADPYDLGPTRPLVPPLQLASVYALPDLDALERIYAGRDVGYIYARDAHPNGRELADDLARFEAAEWGLIAASGMAAISVALLGLLQPGDRIVASELLYGRTAQLLDGELARWGVTIDWVDSTDLAAVARSLGQPTKILLVESISNPLLRMADLPALAALADKRGCILMVDNTFATPALLRPLDHGASLVVESLTKLIGGHSDLTLGALCGQDAEFATRAKQVASVWGFSPPPFDCWLARRGLETLHLRATASSRTTRALAEWCETQPAVQNVIYPGLASHPDHELAEALLPAGAGNMLALELRGGRDGVNRFIKAAQGIPFSPSLGHTGTTCSHPASTSHRALTAAERKRVGITDGLVRLSVGIEPLEQVQEAMAKGLKRV